MGRAARFNQVWYFIFNIRTPGLHLVQYTRSRLNERSKRLKAPKTPALWRYNTLRLRKKGLKFLFQQNPPERSVPVRVSRRAKHPTCLQLPPGN